MQSEEPTEEQLDEFRKKYPKFFAAVFDESNGFGDQLKIAALFIMAYECFKDYIENSFTDFFCHEWKANKHGELVRILDKDFEATRLKYSKGKDKCSLFEVACNWFQDMQAFDDDDIVSIGAITDIRNDLTHELFVILLDDKHPPLEKRLIYAPINLYHKATNWWICNVEAGVAPEEYENFDDEAMRSATGLQVQILSMLADRM